jgi:hypothetical protein
VWQPWRAGGLLAERPRLSPLVYLQERVQQAKEPHRIFSSLSAVVDAT